MELYRHRAAHGPPLYSLRIGVRTQHKPAERTYAIVAYMLAFGIFESSRHTIYNRTHMHSHIKMYYIVSIIFQFPVSAGITYYYINVYDGCGSEFVNPASIDFSLYLQILICNRLAVGREVYITIMRTMCGRRMSEASFGYVQK